MLNWCAVRWSDFHMFCLSQISFERQSCVELREPFDIGKTDDCLQIRWILVCPIFFFIPAERSLMRAEFLPSSSNLLSIDKLSDIWGEWLGIMVGQFWSSCDRLFDLGICSIFRGFCWRGSWWRGLNSTVSAFSVFPIAPPASLLGTSEFAGICGTSVAAMNYVKAVRLRWDIMVAAAMMAFVSSFAGAVTVRYMPSTYLRSALPFVLAAIAVYTFWRKDLGGQAALRYSGRKELLLAVVVGAVIGFLWWFFWVWHR